MTPDVIHDAGNSHSDVTSDVMVAALLGAFQSMSLDHTEISCLKALVLFKTGEIVY